MSDANRSYAGFWVRAGAVLIDGLVLFLPQMAIGAIFGMLIGDQMTAAMATMGGQIALSLVYFSYFHASSGATVGKRVFGLKVISSSGQANSFGKMFIRELVKIPGGLFFGLGYAFAGFTEKKQGWHDYAAGTYVVRAKKADVASVDISHAA